ncbi:MAG: SMC-Scp complex subunit ScpB, partial [Acidobacteriota bacterium]|nr:SMC-Scp complex subunit ScpB [Acidobacteriota bacterium]
VGGVIKTLLEKRLITTAGRKEVIGRPILYRTSKQFLMRFGLSDLDELPSLKEFEQLAQAALGSDVGIAPAEPESGYQTESGAAEAAKAESLEAVESADTPPNLESGDDNDLAELGEDEPGSEPQTRAASAGTNEGS